jgi:hypothetical protein
MPKVSAAFISLPLRGQDRIPPGISAKPNKSRGIIRSGRGYGERGRCIEKLKQQWTQFMSEASDKTNCD